MIKVLLIGKPGIGKSTVMKKFHSLYDGAMVGIVSREITDTNGQRVGFEAVNLAGEAHVFAHKHVFQGASYVLVGKTLTDVRVIDSFVVPEIARGLEQQGALILIDEIGKMQMLSKYFQSTMENVFFSDANVLATLFYATEDWTLPYRENAQTVLVEVTVANRDLLPSVLVGVFQYLNDLKMLSQSQQKTVLQMTREYFTNGDFIQLNKLFSNAISYVLHKKVRRNGDHYSVQGKHGQYDLMYDSQTHVWTCNCSLFLGKERYAGHPGECSHIQATKLFCEK